MAQTMAEGSRALKHSDSGERCTVAHFDGEGKTLPACVICSCGEYIRPEHWGEHVRGGDPVALAYKDDSWPV
jgi:hypothetical protein